ncbi:MAG: AI-2E family transporter, partial [bacterium]|nr:AI-2E family transporter [bacterium]
MDAPAPRPRLSQLYKQGLFVALGALTSIVLIYAVFLARNVIMMFAVAGLLAYLLAGPIDWLADRFGRRRLFTVLVFIVFVFLMLGLFSSFIPIVASQISGLIENMPGYVAQLEQQLMVLNSRYGIGEPEMRLSDYLNQIVTRVKDGSPDLLSKALGYGKTVLS